MATQEILVSLLKQKGTGKTMSKSLSAAQCAEVVSCFQSQTCSDVTKTTLWVALSMLDNTAEEQALLTELNNSTSLPDTCVTLLNGSDDAFIHCIQKILKHNDLNEDEMTLGIHCLFDNNKPMTEKAAFLEGLRLKEESSLENDMMMSAYLKNSRRLLLDIPLLIDLSTAYDGFNRSPQLIAFMAPVLASLGYPVLLHGCEEVSPKRGINVFKLLRAAGKTPTKPFDDLEKDLQSPSCSWAYCDQSISFPEGDALRDLRQLMVKRPVLATVEKLCQPIVSHQRNILVTGYTHPPYRQKSISLLNRVKEEGFLSDYLIVRGVEGSCQLPMDRRSPLVKKLGKLELSEGFVSPHDYGFKQEDRLDPMPDISVEDTLDIGRSILNNQPSLYKDQLIYNCLALLIESGLETDVDSTKSRIEEALRSGKALSCWNAF